MRVAVLVLVVLLGGVTPPGRLAAQAPPLVAPTDALSPEQELKGFKIPPGFEVQLVASEPRIQKPMQLAFDAKGRLWVTTSYHYPFAAEQGKGTDKLFLLSDIDPATGKAGKVQIFADDLNIPIGVLPLPDCKSVIVSSTGEIRKYTDTNDDGKADKMEVLFSGFGFIDTHGMTNSFTLMPDGWVYACHGFRNDSKVKGKDGHEVVMNSGNTFRFRPDGSRIEIYTHGQVNPFGIAVDPWFNLYTADCHSKPITQLIPGATYQSFAKGHDGLGFAPHVTRHDHASTGLCGVAWYDADQFPKDYLGCMFVGNVVTSRINFDRIEWRGATPVAKELPDFLTSEDLWFRPVDIKLGPDGALYVSDFYNKIIGHYEVPLKHPGRDRDRGRLWRIVWKGKTGEAPAAKFAYSDLTGEKPENLDKLLCHPNLTVRLQATNQAIFHAKDMMARVGPNETYTAHRLWVDEMRSWMYAHGDLKRGEYGNDQPLVASHQYRIQRAVQELLRERKKPLGITRQKADLAKANPHIARAAVEWMGGNPKADFAAMLVDLIKKIPPDDTHLRTAARVALRDCLRDIGEWPNDSDPVYTDIALAIRDLKAASYLLTQLKLKSISLDKLTAAAEHVARYGTPGDEKLLFESLRSTTDEDPEPFLAAFRGVQARGAKLGQNAAQYLLNSAQGATHAGDYPGTGRAPEGVSKVLWGLRVLNALPAVLDRSDFPKVSRPKPSEKGHIEWLVTTVRVPDEIRTAAAEVLLKYDPELGVTVGRSLLADSTTPPVLRERLVIILAASSNREARLDARDVLKDAPYRTAVTIGIALASTVGGADDLLEAVKQGKAPARLLQEKAILERLRAAKVADLDKQIAALTKGLPPLDQKILAVMKQRAAAFPKVKPDKEAGAKLFVKHCGACHKIGETGGKIAPQLDGIGNRGLERLLEDTLDPNRNVDSAFRARIITTKAERTITGLMLRVEGEVLVVADDQGKEIRVPINEIDTNRETMLSPMPANFGEVIPESDFHHLMAYLLEQKVIPKKN